jgi:hypothetical protein
MTPAGLPRIARSGRRPPCVGGLSEGCSIGLAGGPGRWQVPLQEIVHFVLLSAGAAAAVEEAVAPALDRDQPPVGQRTRCPDRTRERRGRVVAEVHQQQWCRPVPGSEVPAGSARRPAHTGKSRCRSTWVRHTARSSQWQRPERRSAPGARATARRCIGTAAGRRSLGRSRARPEARWA